MFDVRRGDILAIFDVRAIDVFVWEWGSGSSMIELEPTHVAFVRGRINEEKIVRSTMRWCFGKVRSMSGTFGIYLRNEIVRIIDR